MRRIRTVEELRKEDALASSPYSASTISFTLSDDGVVEMTKPLVLVSSPGREHIDEVRKCAEEELEKRARSRQMSGTQEVWNAITMLVTPAFGLFFALSGMWVTEDTILQAKEHLLGGTDDFSILEPLFEGEGRCIYSTYFPNLYAMPPLTTMSIVVGYLIHSPCSIYYHLLCAFKLPPGKERLDHWSRKLDQAMIYVMSFFTCYGTSGSSQYAVVSMIFSVDSIYRLFQPVYRPKSILVRMSVAFLMPVLPAILYGYHEQAKQFFIIFAVSGWMFASYPLGGYSHGIFHLIAALSNPLQLGLSTMLSTSEEAIQIAASCAVMKEILGS
mmetsp:Transcript_13418/g.20152  ORF Transcript_13418/g.20152 Transcript_13418/m.20152 type:complete len:329 (-) Transcript_13418:39-1025(-)